MNRLSTLVTFLLVTVATLLAVTCSHAIDAPAKAGAGQRLKTIIINNYHPYSFLDDKGEADDFSVEIARAVAKAIDLELEIRADKWDRAMKELEAGSIDLLPLMAYTRSWSFAVKAGNLALLERLNQGLNIIKSSGEYDAIYKKWFGALEGTHFNLKRLLPYGFGALLIFLGIITWNVMLNRATPYWRLIPLRKPSALQLNRRATYTC